MKKTIITITLIGSFLALTSCASYPNRTALNGALIGGLAGKSTGNHSDRRALEGALLGGLAGHVVGNEQEARRTQNNRRYYNGNGHNHY